MGGLAALAREPLTSEAFDGVPPEVAGDVAAEPWNSPPQCMSEDLDGVSEDDFDYDFDDDFEEEEDDGYGEFDEADFEQGMSDPGDCALGEEEEEEEEEE